MLILHWIILGLDIILYLLYNILPFGALSHYIVIIIAFLV